MSAPTQRDHPPLFELAGAGFARSGRDILADVDWRIAAGELVRRLAQGEPYWMHEGRDAKS